jgi:microcompartment protein CcmK/EutM
LTIGKVVGNLVSTIKIPSHRGIKLMLLREVDELGNEFGPIRVAMDHTCSGTGDYVLFTLEGGAAKMIVGEEVETDAAILGILDQVPTI